jgi:integrase
MELHKLKAGQLAKLPDGGPRPDGERRTRLHNDGGGLYLQVRGDNRSWLFRYKPRGQRVKLSRTMGLGALDTENAGASLALARELAADARRHLAAGIDPRAHRDKERAKEAAKQRRVPTFKDYATRYVKAHLATWKNEKHRQQWVNTLGLDIEGYGERESDHCASLHGVRLDAIDTAAVRKVLDPIWHTLPETASRLRGRIERVLNAAATDNHRSGPNPARWQGHLETIYPAKRKVRPVRHHPALPWQDVPAFMVALRQREGVAERCIELMVLTATRSQEARRMRFEEIDWDARKWTIPAERMKRDRPHAVPLGDAAIAVLKRMEKTRINPFVFPGQKRGTPISDTALRDVLRDMGLSGDDATCHGMRSSVRDFAAEATHTPNIVAEKMLAHGISDGTEEAYRRGDLFEKRRELMDEWGRFCAGEKPAALAGEKRQAPQPAAPAAAA